MCKKYRLPSKVEFQFDKVYKSLNNSGDGLWAKVQQLDKDFNWSQSIILMYFRTHYTTT